MTKYIITEETYLDMPDEADFAFICEADCVENAIATEYYNNHPSSGVKQISTCIDYGRPTPGVTNGHGGQNMDGWLFVWTAEGDFCGIYTSAERS